MMKILLILVTLLCGVLAKSVILDAMKLWSKMDSAHNVDCATSESVIGEQIDKAILTRCIPNELNNKKYFLCVYKKLNVFHEDGAFCKHAIVNKFKPISGKLVNKCIKVSKTETEQLEKVYSFVNCILGDIILS